MAKPVYSTDKDASHRKSRVREIIKDIIRRRASGESITDRQAIELHYEWMPELAVELTKLQMLESAQQRAEKQGELDHFLHIRCPHCQKSIELYDDADLSLVQCVFCQTSFSLVNEYDDVAPVRIGQFEVLEQIGVGAFGAVWKARDVELERMVALKLPHGTNSNAEDSEILVREARLAAQLIHPHIARVYEVGNDHGQIFLVTELIHGQSLAQCVAKRQFRFRESAKLCILIAEALNYAHNNNIVHRDLKPSNIMLDELGEPHLTDFGLAKRDDGQITITADGKLLGTPAYMSPELARGAANIADRRTDIYSLGVVLFELLTRERPFRGSSQMIIQQILLEDAISPRTLNRNVPKDLETICLKCLEKDPEHRYQRADEVVRELQRFLSGEPVRARPITRPIRIWRWCCRNSRVAGLSVSLLLSLVMGLIGTTSYAFREREARRLAAAATDEAKSEAEDRRQQQYISDMSRVQAAIEAHDIHRGQDLLESHRPRDSQKDLRRFEWYYLERLCREHQAEFTLPGGVGPIAFSPDGRQIAIASPTELALYGVSPLKKKWSVTAHENLPSGLAFLDEQKLATGSWDGTVKLWHWDEHDPVHRVLAQYPGHKFHLAASDDGKWLATNSPSNQVLVWNVAQERIEFRLDEHPAFVRTMAFSPDGHHFASGDSNGNLWLWNLDSRITVHRIAGAHGKEQVQKIVFTSDGNSMVSCGRDDWVRIWNVDNGNPTRSFQCASEVFSIAISPDDQTLAASVWDGTIRLWDLDSKQEVRTINADMGYAMGLAYSSRGNLLAASGSRFTVNAWDLSRPRLPDELHGRLLQLSQDQVIYKEHDGNIRSIKLDELQSDEFLLPVPFTPTLAISPDGNFMATAGPKNRVDIVDLRSELVRTLTVDHGEPVNWLEFSERGNLLAIGQEISESTDHLVTVCDYVNENKLFSIQAHHDAHHDFPMAVSPDGQSLAITQKNDGMTFSVQILDRKGQSKRLLPENNSPFFAMQFSDDGQTLACGDWLGGIKVWDVSTGDQKLAVIAHNTPIHSIAISPDTTRIATGSGMGVVKLFDVLSGQQILTLRGPTGDVSALEFSDNGRTLVGSSDTETRIWRTTSH